VFPLKLTRRAFCIFTGASLASACSRVFVDSALARDGRLTARPREGVETTASGQITLDLDHERKAILQLPQIAGGSPLPLLVMLHGATQSAEDMFWYLGTTPEEAGIAVLAPNSRDTTWDAIGGSFGRDVVSLNLALERVFETVAIDPAHVAIGGFSDGASYAISLGLINGDLFRSVVAFSPGFVVSGTPLGKPRIFISHGTDDRILPIDRCGRRIAATLVTRGYDVDFREFDGAHEIPGDIARAGLHWIKS
jgi:phospholipase/carboxylesterase